MNPVLDTKQNNHRPIDEPLCTDLQSSIMYMAANQRSGGGASIETNALLHHPAHRKRTKITIGCLPPCNLRLYLSRNAPAYGNLQVLTLCLRFDVLAKTMTILAHKWLIETSPSLLDDVLVLNSIPEGRLRCTQTARALSKSQLPEC